MAHIVQDGGLRHSVESKWCQMGGKQCSKGKASSCYKKTFVEKVMGNYDVDLLWLRTCSDIKWLEIDNHDTIERENHCVYWMKNIEKLTRILDRTKEVQGAPLF